MRYSYERPRFSGEVGRDPTLGPKRFDPILVVAESGATTPATMALNDKRWPELLDCGETYPIFRLLSRE